MKSILRPLLALSAALWLASCTGALADRTSTLVLNFHQPSRSVMPDWSAVIQTYDVTLTNTDANGYAPIAVTGVTGGSASIAGVGPGLWSIDVVARDASSAQVAAAHLTNRTLPTAVAINVVLAPTQVGQGSFTYVASYPDAVGITSVTAQLYAVLVAGHAAGDLIGTVSPTNHTDDTTTSSDTFFASNLPSGYYRLVLTFSRPGSIARVSSEAVNVWDGVASDRWLDNNGSLLAQQSFVAADFNSDLADLFDLVATVDGNPLVLGTGFSSSTYAYTTALASATATQTVTLTPTEMQANQFIQIWDSATTTWQTVASGATATYTLGKGATQLKVWVTATDGQTQQFYVLDFNKVVNVASIALPAGQQALTLAPAATATLTPTFSPANADNQSVLYSSDNLSVATVDAAGVVTAVAPGIAIVTVTANDGGSTTQSTVTVTGSQALAFGWINYGALGLTPSATTVPAGNAVTLTSSNGYFAGLPGTIWNIEVDGASVGTFDYATLAVPPQALGVHFVSVFVTDPATGIQYTGLFTLTVTP